MELDPRWRKSSYSGNGGVNCVEVGSSARVILVRDTQDRDGGTLAFTAEAWRRLVADVRTGSIS